MSRETFLRRRSSMSTFDPQSRVQNVMKTANAERQRAGLALPAQPENGAEAPISPWLYVAGLLVTLSGLYAVNFGLEDSNFASMTYILATCGYALSYILRIRRVSLQSLHVPLIVCLG